MCTFPIGTYRWIGLALALSLASCGGAASPPSMTANGDSGFGSGPLLSSSSLASLSPIVTRPGAIDGTDNEFSPVDGDTSSGGQGSTVDGKVPCLPVMGNGYHIHVFLGIVYHGQLMSIPDTIGMVDPGPEINGYTNTAKCFYEIHTHDASGIVHLEVAQPYPISSVVFKMKNVLDVWGVPHSARSFGPFKGKIRVFTGMPPALGQTRVSAYTPYTGKHWTLMGLHSHEVVWIEIGKPYFNAAQLPPVTFYMEY